MVCVAINTTTTQQSEGRVPGGVDSVVAQSLLASFADSMTPTQQVAKYRSDPRRVRAVRNSMSSKKGLAGKTGVGFDVVFSVEGNPWIRNVEGTPRVCGRHAAATSRYDSGHQ